MTINWEEIFASIRTLIAEIAEKLKGVFAYLEGKKEEASQVFTTKPAE